MKTKKNILFKVSLTHILTLTLFWGCEKEYDNVVETQSTNYQVINVTAKDSIQYPIDISATFTIEFNNSDDIKNVKFDLYSPEKEKISSGVSLLDNGKDTNGDVTANDDIYSAKISIDSNNINGNYELKYFVTDNLDITKQVATAKYYYNNGKSNAAPVISDEIIDPDTVSFDSTSNSDSTVFIWCTLKVIDDNGKNDISKVYFTVYKPDGSTNNSQLELYDDGDVSNHGDLVANDGNYSLIISVKISNDKGNYRFEFRAKDRSNKLSNIINHTVRIQWK